MTSPANPNTSPEGWSAHRHGLPEYKNVEWIVVDGERETGRLIATINGDEGDARIVAAAPALYEALKDAKEQLIGCAEAIEDNFRSPEFGRRSTDLIRSWALKADAALLKARGPQHDR